MDPDKMQEKIDELEEQFRQDQNRVRDEEEDLNDSENQIEDAEVSEREEIEEGEEEGNVPEIEDAEKKMEKILDFLKKEEKEAGEIESRIKEELEIELEEAQIIEEMEGSLDQEFSDAVKRLRSHKEKFQQVKEKRQNVPKKYYKNIEETLQEIRYGAEVFRRALKKEDELFEQLEETEKEEDNFEKLFQRLEKELDIGKQEVKELIRDSEKIGVPEDVEEAEEEGQEIQALLNHIQEEEGGIRQIDEEIQAEIQEIGNILGEDEKILEEMEACRELLEELDQIMNNEIGILSFGKNSSNAESVIEDIETTDKKLKTMLNEDRNFVDAMENGFSTLQKAAPNAGTAARAGITASKLGLLAVGVIIAASILYISFL